MAEAQAPTVDDLRVKLCYICREEERYDQPETQQNMSPWVHPCNCTLVAHESCLLEWIKSAQQNPSRAANALKCPQCGAEYEMESDNPLTLRLMNFANKLLTMGGRVVLAVNFSTLIVAFGTGLYIVSTAYGLHAMQQFLGKEMYDTLLTDDPNNWPFHAWFNLPLIPISLILSRTSLSETGVSALLPLFVAWPVSRPVGLQGGTSFFQSAGEKLSKYFPVVPDKEGPFSWPPGPIVSIILYGLVRGLYRRYWSEIAHWVLDHTPAVAPEGRRRRRFLWDLDEDGAGPLRIRIAANVLGERRQRQGGQGNQQQQQDAPVQQPQQQGEDQQQDGDGNADDEPTARYTGSSLGRLIGGALLIPKISNYMGSLLYRLSQHSPLLRRFLGIRLPTTVGLQLHETVTPAFAGLTPAQQVAAVSRAALRVFFHGTKQWSEMDPVWFRNTIGLGLFVVAKDCVELFYAWLCKKELESRHVKTRPFRGIDARELDLIPPRVAI
ncbi:hypothetical protein OE88DRAFT_1684957 [Heliocybe sulcata]|uniref:RING-CH-type domain-containing protein n=1 Tax=Heliocybe sulcata TaxID=5364 RepID=A0A5C3MX02_9AGAM|nr:hypothetical protein OE88DRAFT_1684957 [Heliocybe sulcata]